MQQRLSDLSGGYNVHGVYNATHYALDIAECMLGWCGIATPPVKELHKVWDHFFTHSSPDATFLNVAHSQGCIHLANALESYPLDLKKRIYVVAIAPAKYIDKENCKKVWHYRAQPDRDLIPMLDIIGGTKAISTIITLDSDIDANIIDHNFNSPTYRRNLIKHLKKYTQNGGKTF
jgi:hypothetical protein